MQKLSKTKSNQITKRKFHNEANNEPGLRLRTTATGANDKEGTSGNWATVSRNLLGVWQEALEWCSNLAIMVWIEREME